MCFCCSTLGYFFCIKCNSVVSVAIVVVVVDNDDDDDDDGDNGCCEGCVMMMVEEWCQCYYYHDGLQIVTFSGFVAALCNF